VIGGWRELHNEEPQNLSSMLSRIRLIKSMRMGWAGYVARIEAKMNAYRTLVGKPK
jgi:hypothetical protein